MTTATHPQNGQHWGNANGNHGAQKPADVGKLVDGVVQLQRRSGQVRLHILSLT